MTAFDKHTCCARHDKGHGVDLCVLKQECHLCNALTTGQKTLLATPSSKLKKEKKGEKSFDD